jgi:hypothetical protein
LRGEKRIGRWSMILQGGEEEVVAVVQGDEEEEACRGG